MNESSTGSYDVAAFIAAIDHPVRRKDAQSLDLLFRDETGWAPQMWGPTIIGYGSYAYKYESGRTGSSLATGFSPRKANQVLYIMPGYADFGQILARIGKYKMGKSCLYINKLGDVDIDVVREIIRAGLTDLNKIWPVKPS